MKSEVYFTRKITPEAIVEAYSKLGIELPGKVAVKVHSGEDSFISITGRKETRFFLRRRMKQKSSVHTANRNSLHIYRQLFCEPE